MIVARKLLLLCAMLFAWAPAVHAERVLFVGNSFTFGALSPVFHFHPERVHDLNGDGVGGVPALFATFAQEAGLHLDVSLETTAGMTLPWHFANRRDRLAGAWNHVVLQGYSTLDPERPGNPASHIAGARDLARLFKAANPEVSVDLVSTWSRADQVYPAKGHWHGRPITAMADDLAAASDLALRQVPELAAVSPVGEAWNIAIRERVADPNPYDGIAKGQIDLWGPDHYHASTAGYYLEALVDFGLVTGRDPRTLGPKESAAKELGLSPVLAATLQQIAQDALTARH